MYQQQKLQPQLKKPSLSLIPLGGMEDITKNMYLYEYQNEILIVDCGIGFTDASMLGIDLLLPDITYLLQTKKKIVGLLLTHGHEDHIGALPFILPQLPKIPVFGTPFTAALANEKLKEFKLPANVNTVTFNSPPLILGNFRCSFIRVTHSVPDTAHIFIQTPAGNMYHGSDYKIDLTPQDRQYMDFQSIVAVGHTKILGHLIDALGSDRAGHTPSDENLGKVIEDILLECKGKAIITTYSSNVARINQIIQAAEKLKKKVCFIGRSIIKVVEVATRLGYLKFQEGTIIEFENLQNYPTHQVVLIVAGSQGQENSAMTRIAEGEHKEIKIAAGDVVVISADPIPGNEESVNSLVDSISKTGARVITSGNGRVLHVSGHGSQQDHLLMMSLLKARYIIPISGNYRHLVMFKELAQKLGYRDKDIIILENGQEVIFSEGGYSFGRRIPIKNVYVDQISGEEVEGFVLRDREKLAKDGIIILMVEINAADGQLAETPDLIIRGISPKETQVITSGLVKEISNLLSSRRGRVKNWIQLRKDIEEVTNKFIYKKFRRRPLVIPVIIEV